ncbi:hypothetical protein L0669_17180 [Flavobacterium bizetiae]|uniref:hypothetical protein n=1 Tax=Flavobacterium bizetiae TaxID=2704140 RepID=UPI0021E78BD0|nr:hypothetical protein [Flavobacterium bizetiae]UTN03059.1 hypothetical protein L0669_17180 [Flavobacterium bizetiae]
MKTQIVLFLVFIYSYSNAQNLTKVKIDSLFTEFKKESFYANVYPAKQKLEEYQKITIPELINLLKDDNFVKLTNTFDLIYPGTTVFYGHGYYIPYDIDWIAVRSGWLLEDITFQDFGYQNLEVDNATLMNHLIKNDYENYTEKGIYELDWKNITSTRKKELLRKILSKKAEKWWRENQYNWNRISAIKEALVSKNKSRLSNVFQYLRYGDSKCDNLTKEVYHNEIEPIIIALRKTNQYPEIQEQIELLLNESITSKILDKKET